MLTSALPLFKIVEVFRLRLTMRVDIVAITNANVDQFVQASLSSFKILAGNSKNQKTPLQAPLLA